MDRPRALILKDIGGSIASFGLEIKEIVILRDSGALDLQPEA
jgi:hypothetical protein